MQAQSKGNDDPGCTELEKRKYEEMWAVDIYSKTSPAYHRFFDQVTGIVEPGDKVIEFGCGTGIGLNEIAKTNDVLGIDIAHNCLKYDLPFKQACLWEPMDVAGDVGFCVDVMEHIPPQKIDDTFSEIMACVPKCLFIACLLDDHLGMKHINQPLHLTLRSPDWWLDAAKKYGKVTHLFTDVRAVHFVIES